MFVRLLAVLLSGDVHAQSPPVSVAAPKEDEKSAYGHQAMGRVISERSSV